MAEARSVLEQIGSFVGRAYLLIAIAVGGWTHLSKPADYHICLARQADIGGVSALSSRPNVVTFSMMKGVTWPIGLMSLMPLKDMEPVKLVVNFLHQDPHSCR